MSGEMEELLSEIENLLHDGDPAGEAAAINPLTIQPEPGLLSTGFLQLECLEKDTGRCLAIRNFWSLLCR